MDRPLAELWFRRHAGGVTAIVSEMLGVFQLSAHLPGAPILVGRFVRDIPAAHVEGDRLVAMHFDHACSDECEAWTRSGTPEVNRPNVAALKAETSIEMSSAGTGVDDSLLQRIRCEFLEMPGLRLTAPQAKRLWGLNDAACSASLAALIDSQFLFQTRDGAFMRIERAHVKASLRPVERPAVA